MARRRLQLALLVIWVPLWLSWPLLRPRLWPASGRPWLVVLDGYHRLDWALERQARSTEPILLISCPSTGQPAAAQRARQRASALLHPQPPPLLVLQQGFDTATQAAALAQWLQRRQRQGHPPPRQLLLVSDPHHFPRALWATQIAVGGSGSQVVALPVPNSSSASPAGSWWSHGPLWRDALRLQLWRAKGSTGAFVNPAQLRNKIESCW